MDDRSASATVTKISATQWVFGYCASVVAAEIVAAFSPVVAGGLFCLLAFVLIVHAVWLTPRDVPCEADGGPDAVLGATLLILALVPLASLWSLMLPVRRIPTSLWPALVAVPTLVGVVAVAGVVHIDLLGRWQARIQLQEVALVASAVPLMWIGWVAMPDRVLQLRHSSGGAVVLAATLAFALGVVEELLFRGALQPCVIKVVGVRAGVLTVAGVSALAAAGNRSVAGLLLLFAVGIGFGYVAARSGSVRAPALAKGLMLAGLVVLSAVH